MIWALHGMFGSSGDWEFLGDGVRAVDLWEEEPMPFEEWAERFNERVGGEDDAPVVVGYSMGGRLALHALLAASELWRGAVIVSANPGVCEDREGRLAADRGWAERVRTEEWAALMADWNAQAVFGGEAREGFGEQCRERVAAGFDAWSLGRQADLRSRFGEVSCPLLWITGEDDPKFTAIAQGLGVEHEVWPCGHRVPWADEARFRRRILEFQNAAVGRSD